MVMWHVWHGQAERAGDAQNKGSAAMDNPDYTELNWPTLQDALDWRASEAQMPEAEVWRPYEM